MGLRSSIAIVRTPIPVRGVNQVQPHFADKECLRYPLILSSSDTCPIGIDLTHAILRHESSSANW